MIPEKIKLIDELRGYSNGALKLLRWGTTDKEKRIDLEIVMRERGLLQ